MLPDEVKTRMVEKLIQKVYPSFVILYGSFAKGTVRGESDIDLAFFGDKRLSAYERFDLANELAMIGGRDVDLVDIRDADAVLAVQIFAHGIPLYIRDENEYLRQRMRAFSMYADFNERLAPVMEAIKSRGSVYGDE